MDDATEMRGLSCFKINLHAIALDNCKMSILLVLDVTVQGIFNWLRNGAEIQELLQGRVKMTSETTCMIIRETLLLHA